MGIWSNIVKIFTGKKNNQAVGSSFQTLITLNPFGADTKANEKANATYESCISLYVRVLSKLKPMCIFEKAPDKDYPNIDYLLRFQPNPTQNAINFWRQVIDSYYTSNLAFIWIDRDLRKVKLDEQVRALYALDIADVNFQVAVDESTSAPIETFLFNLNGVQKAVKADDMIVLARRPTIGNPYSSNNEALKKIVQLVEDNFTGLTKSIKEAGIVRFIATSTRVLNDDQRRERQDRLNQLISEVGANGALYSDASEGIVPINSNNAWTGTDKVTPFIEQIYTYFGVSKSIVDGTATDDQYNNWVETSVDPFADELGVELSLKLLSRKAIAGGRRIVVDTRYLFTASQAHRLQAGQLLVQSGYYYTNDIRRLAGVDPLPPEENILVKRLDRLPQDENIDNNPTPDEESQEGEQSNE